MFNDKYPSEDMVGIFSLTILEYDKKNVPHIVDQYLEEFNLIPDVAREVTAKVTGGDSNFIVDTLAIGIGLHGGTATNPGQPAPSDTGLENQQFSRAIQSVTHPLTTNTLYSCTILRAEANGSPDPQYTEAALLANNGTPLALKTHPLRIKDPDREFIYDWTINY